MDSIANHLGFTGVGLAAVIVIFCAALMVLVAAFRPNRQYLGVPKGEYPQPGTEPRTVRESGGEPSLRSVKPDIGPAEAGYIYRDCDGAEMTLATIVDLASRRYLDIVEYQELAIPRPTSMIVVRRGPDDSLTRQERALLELFAIPGAAESPDFVAARPFKPIHFRSQLQTEGVSKFGSPTARVSGLRRSIAELIGRDVASSAVTERGWYDNWRERIASVGAVMLLGGGIASVVTMLWWFFGELSGYWSILSCFVAIVGAMTFVGTEGRTADGTVVRDQARGFRRYLVDAPSPPATAMELATFGGWAVALDCIDEWEQSLERLGGGIEVEEAVPWLFSTRGPIRSWREVADAIKFMQARIHAEEASKDSRTPLPPVRRGWASIESAW